MKSSIDIKKVKLFLWIGLAFLLMNMINDFTEKGTETFQAILLNNAWIVIYLVCLNFIFFEYALPFIKPTFKRILVSPFLLLFFILLYSCGVYAWRYIGIQLHIYTALKIFSSVESGVTYMFQSGISSAFFFGIIRHIYNYRKLKAMAQQLRIEKQEAELNYLKSQTNPHFLFNTLNNIYSLARDKSDMAAESILRLSKILRFMLYETGGAYICIDQEVKVIGDYIALEKLRYDDSLRINFNHNVEDMNQSLPPLLLMPLVENAFKHGVSETRILPFVDIHLSVNKRQLVFLIKNSMEDISGEERIKENIGLSNLRRQLELLYTDYNLSVNQSASVFTTTLKINLASNA